jgi:hypothetical protein
VLDIDKQIQIMNDNQGARSLAQNPIQHSRTKHIDIRHHFIREILQRKEIEIKYIQTSEMVADFLTKPLSKFKHNYCLENFGVKNIELKKKINLRGAVVILNLYLILISEQLL